MNKLDFLVNNISTTASRDKELCKEYIYSYMCSLTDVSEDTLLSRITRILILKQSVIDKYDTIINLFMTSKPLLHINSHKCTEELKEFLKWYKQHLNE